MADGIMRERTVEVSGESFGDRQSVIAKCKDGDLVVLVREPSNQYDPNAIRVQTTAGEQIGYVPKAEARNYAWTLDNNWPISAKIKRIYGGTAEKPTRGVVLLITEYSKVLIAQ